MFINIRYCLFSGPINANALPAVEHLMTYWAILEKVRGSQLRLTKMDDEIYEHFKKEFPDFDPAETVDEDKMKSKEGKEKWRNFMNQYDGKINDFNFGTIIRNNPKVEYEQDTTIFGKLSMGLFSLPRCTTGLTRSKRVAHAILRNRDRKVSFEFLVRQTRAESS